MINITGQMKEKILACQSFSEFMKIVEAHKTELPGEFSLTDFSDEIFLHLQHLVTQGEKIKTTQQYPSDPLKRRK